MLTAEQLREHIHYDPLTGVITSRDDGRVLAHHRGGNAKQGHYVGIMVLGEQLYAHRAIWCYMTGAWPEHTVDHRDGVRSNNVWENLRAATPAQQIINQKPRNKHKLRGIYRHKHGLFGARICEAGKTRSLGYYNCPAAAHFAYVVEAAKVYGEFARTG